MPSFTSNSDYSHHRAPSKNWLLVWGFSFVAAGILISGAEVFWRGRGHRPSAVDSLEHWAYFRSRVSDNRHDHVVLLGSSRIQLGFSTDTFREQCPGYRLTPLATDALYPVAALRDLAADERFRGIVLCSMTAIGFGHVTWDDLEGHVEFYHREYALRHALDHLIGSYLQGHFVVLNPNVRIDQVVRTVLAGDPLPSPSYIVLRDDRSRLADYSMMVDLEAHRRHRLEALEKWMAEHEPPSADDWMKDVERVEDDVRRIQARGGKVVFIRFPTIGEHWIIDQAHYPKADYWDRMAAFTSAETIHFADVPSLGGFDLPDASHLDQKDAPEFTSALLKELRRRDVLK